MVSDGNGHGADFRLCVPSASFPAGGSCDQNLHTESEATWGMDGRTWRSALGGGEVGGGGGLAHCLALRDSIALRMGRACAGSEQASPNPTEVTR